VIAAIGDIERTGGMSRLGSALRGLAAEKSAAAAE